MENLFIENSSVDHNKLVEAKAFLDNIIAQVTQAYNGVRVRTRHYLKTTEINIGIHPNESCCHRFTVNEDGVIEFESRSELFFESSEKQTAIAKDIVKRHPNSTWEKDRLQLILTIESEDDFRNKVKDICMMLEKDGFTLRR
jgi:hypothetical protein